MLVGRKRLIISNEGLRYSLVPGLNPDKYFERRGINVNGNPDFGKKITCTVSRNGDLIHRVYLQVTLPKVEVPCDSSHCFRWVNYVGHALIKTVDVEIGGQRIDRHYGDWLNIWNELTQEPGHQVGYDNMVGNTIALTGTGLNRTEATTLYIPLQFWLNYLT